MFYALSNVSIVTAWVDERNIRSQKVLEKLGARKVGKIDDFMYSIREKSFVNIIFYVGSAKEMRGKAKEEAERKGIILKY
jgi:RimJ/RimL family protein N-acetyltransferase